MPLAVIHRRSRAETPLSSRDVVAATNWRFQARFPEAAAVRRDRLTGDAGLYRCLLKLFHQAPHRAGDANAACLCPGVADVDKQPLMEALKFPAPMAKPARPLNCVQS
jgi:hypothetical protein